MLTDEVEDGVDVGDGRPPERPVVTLERDGQRCYIHDLDCLGVLGSLVTIDHRVAKAEDGGAGLARSHEPLWRQVTPSSLACFFAGLEPVVHRLLIDAGYAIRRFDVTCPERTPLPRPDFEAAARLGPPDRAVLDFFHSHERGLVRFGPGVDPGRLVAEAILAFPAATFAVVAERVKDVARFHERFRRLIPGLCWATADRCPASVGRAVVATPYGLANNPIIFRERDVVVALDVVEALGERAQTALSDAALGRLFALLPRDRRLAPRDRDRLVPLFGFDSVVVPRHGCVERSVEAVFARFDGGSASSVGLGGVDLLQQGIWCHPARNRRVARLATALSVGDRGRVAADHPPVDGRLLSLPDQPRVVVLADGVEHALALVDSLPGWPLVIGPHVVAAGLSARRVEVLTRTRWDGLAAPDLAIATLAGLESLDLGEFDVVVRADGGVGMPPRLASITVDCVAEVRPLLVVDFADRHHPMLRRRSRSRRDAYSEAGWVIDGVAAPTPIERFLSTRPGRAR